MKQELEPVKTYPIDHVIARQHGGVTELENLCLSCLRCNRQKGPNIATLDPDTGEMVRLFNPSTDVWEEHFEWDGPRLVGLTSIGRGTVECLAVNVLSLFLISFLSNRSEMSLGMCEFDR